MVFVVLFFIPVLVILLIAALMPTPPPPRRTFAPGQRIKFTHWPGRTAVVARVWDPDDAAQRFPYGVKGAAKPPYKDGVVEATFVDLDPTNGKPYPNEIAAGTSIQ